MAELALEQYLPASLPTEWAKLVGGRGLDLLGDIGRSLDESPGQKAMMTPRMDQILRAFDTPPRKVRVLLVGQDPYPGSAHAMGLAFSVDRNVHSLPPSLINIRNEFRRDTGLPVPTHGDLSPWAENGVLLLNRHLTTLVGSPGAHRKIGWARFTDVVIKSLVESNAFFVSILWGREASELQPLLGELPRIESPHPSPLSARLGFFGSRPFTRANQALEENGRVEIDWSLSVEES
jgi:uracil-DNA glycosylase